MKATEFFDTLEARVDPSEIEGLEHSYLFDIAEEGRWLVDVRGGKLTVTRDPGGGADVEFATSSETFERLVAGTQNPMTAYMTGKIKVKGDMKAALELQKLF